MDMPIYLKRDTKQVCVTIKVWLLQLSWKILWAIIVFNLPEEIGGLT